MNRIRQPFNVNSLAQAAAVAALNDTPFLDQGARVNVALLKQGVIVRPVGNYGLPQWLRISIGLPQENAAFIEALKKALG
jgi:histidinol-phosphate aminotransferase